MLHVCLLIGVWQWQQWHSVCAILALAARVFLVSLTQVTPPCAGPAGDERVRRRRALGDGEDAGHLDSGGFSGRTQHAVNADASSSARLDRSSRSW